MVNEQELRAAVFSVLDDSTDDYESRPFSHLRSEVESILKLPPRSLAEHRETITDMIVEHRNLRAGQYDAAHALEPDDDAQPEKLGKFSKYESEVIMSHVNAYLEANSLDVSDISSTFRDSDAYTRGQHSLLWKDISSELPMRKPSQIYYHAMRQLANITRNGAWTQEEKDTLKAMVKVHGSNWIRIGKLMNRYSLDCKDAYKLFARKKRGRFTEEEDSELTKAVRTVTNSSDDIPIWELPAVDISWKAVGALMGNERIPLDYQRRWHRIRAGGSSATKGRQVLDQPVSASRSLTNKKLLSYLMKSDAEDESELNWNSIDRELNLFGATSLMTWKMMCKQKLFDDNIGFEDRLDALARDYGVREDGSYDEDTESSTPVSTVGGVNRRRTGRSQHATVSSCAGNTDKELDFSAISIKLECTTEARDSTVRGTAEVRNPRQSECKNSAIDVNQQDTGSSFDSSQQPKKKKKKEKSRENVADVTGTSEVQPNSSNVNQQDTSSSLDSSQKPKKKKKKEKSRENVADVTGTSEVQPNSSNVNQQDTSSSLDSSQKPKKKKKKEKSRENVADVTGTSEIQPNSSVKKKKKKKRTKEASEVITGVSGSEECTHREKKKKKKRKHDEII